MAICSETIVVIPTMNRATLVIDALNAILKQTLQPDCLVIVDDSSTDNSLEVIRDWKNKTNPPFETKLIALPYNMGVSVARNVGLAQARSHHRYVYFLDSDDIPSPHFLQHTTAVLNQRPDAVAVTTNTVVEIASSRAPRYSGEKRTAFLSHASIAIIGIRRWYLTESSGIVSSTLFRSSVIKQSRGYNETRLLGEDCELFLQLNLNPWLFVSTCFVTIRDGHLLPIPHTQRNRRKLAHAHESWMDCYTKEGLTSHETTRHMLAYRWRHAGLNLIAKQNLTEAKDCFRRALSWGALGDKKSLVYLTFVLSFGWLLKILGKFGLYEQFVNSVKQILYRSKTRL